MLSSRANSDTQSAGQASRFQVRPDTPVLGDAALIRPSLQSTALLGLAHFDTSITAASRLNKFQTNFILKSGVRYKLRIGYNGYPPLPRSILRGQNNAHFASLAQTGGNGRMNVTKAWRPTWLAMVSLCVQIGVWVCLRKVQGLEIHILQAPHQSIARLG